MDEFTARITGVAHGGYGVCRKEGQVCFVPYALPEDVIRVRVTRQAKKVLWGEIAEVVEPSPNRIENACEHAASCGGCTWLHFAYPAQAQWKQRMVRDALQRIAGIDMEPDWAEEAGLRTGYRTRAEFKAQDGKIGFYALGTHEIADLEHCPLFHEKLNEALAEIRTIPVAGEVSVTINPEGPEVLVWTRKRIPELLNAFPLAQSAADDEPPLSFMFDGVPIVNDTFSQASLLLNRMLVRIVKDFSGTPESLLDLYCGSGNFALQLDVAGELLAIDQNAAAIRAAQKVGRGEFQAGGEREFAAALKRRWDTVLLDPPRAGAKEIAGALADADADAIIYVSCDPPTLARDLKTLGEKGWKPERLVAVDMFPHTFHVETVCRLTR